jgi:GT2 family glycosyltransferase
MNIFPNIAVLITCHNRKEKTINCLKALFNQIGLGHEFLINVFLVDDACTDGTSEAIQYQFPEVNIIQGNGNLFWNRGMHLAWETAAANKDFDYYLWLNDDTFLYDNAILTLLQFKYPNSIVTGTTQSQINYNPTYGGYIIMSMNVISPNENYQQCDYSNGNCVLVPNYVYEKVGNLDPIFHHALGDFDYSLRASKMGIEIYVAPHFIGFCENHENIPKWRSNSLNFINRLKNLYTPLSGCQPPEYFIFDNRHNGLFNACIHFISIHLRCIYPNFWCN